MICVQSTIIDRMFFMYKIKWENEKVNEDEMKAPRKLFYF